MKNELKPHRALKYIMAGRARVAFHSDKTGNTFWYFIRKNNRTGIWSVFANYKAPFEQKLLFTIDSLYRLVKVQKIHNSPTRDLYITAFEHVFITIRGGHQLDSRIHIYHEGRCGYCSRPLTDPLSMELGIGPICRKHLNYEI